MSKSIIQLMRRFPYPMIFGLLVFLFFNLAACGGSESSSATTTSSGATTGGEPGKIITINETHGDHDTYFFNQTKLTVTKGETITIRNNSDEPQDVSQGDALKAGVNLNIGRNRSATVTFNVPGTFSIETNKGATITVTVQ